MVVVIDWCFMCKKAEEMVDHLLIHCDYARELWSLVLSFWGKLGHTSYGFRAAGLSVEESFRSFPQCYLECYSVVFNVVTWRERNCRAFEDLERHSVELKMLLLQTLFHWMAALSSHSLHSVFDLIDSSFLLCLFLVYLLCTRPFILLSMKFYYLTKKKKNHIAFACLSSASLFGTI